MEALEGIDCAAQVDSISFGEHEVIGNVDSDFSGTLNCDEPEDDFAFHVTRQNVQRRVRYAMTNSFGFGGNNATLAFGAAHD